MPEASGPQAISLNPDFDGRFKRALLRQGEPDRVPLADFGIDPVIKWEFLRREIGDQTLPATAPAKGGSGVTGKLPLALEAEFWYRAGFDFVPLQAGIHGRSRKHEGVAHVLRAKYAAFGDEVQERQWANEGKGVITSFAEFESFPWPDPDDYDYSPFAEITH